ncbi:hypothetical protein MPSEU_000066800 [Mayamaea pseudoterrestris]|nr:hypothetical protein MPSEU_000066800 [Mayamaea pseudoterrestris]
MDPSSSLSLVRPLVIQVDVTNPWNNGEFNVWTVRDYELANNRGFIDGYEIEFANANLRDFAKGNYEARLISKNTVEMRLPILPLLFLQDDAYLGSAINPSSKPRLDLRAAFLAKQVQQMHRFVHLRFPDDITNKFFLPGGRTDETLLDIESFPHTGSIELPEATIRSLMLRQQPLVAHLWRETRLVWRVALNVEPRVSVMPSIRADGMHAFFSSVYGPSAASQMQAVVPFVAAPVAPAPVASSSAIAAAPVASSAIAAPTLGSLQLAELLADTDALMVDLNRRKRLAAEVGERQNEDEDEEEEHVSFESPRKRQAKENELVLQHQPDQVWGALPVEDIDVAEEEEEKEDDPYDPFDYGVDGDPDM